MANVAKAHPTLKTLAILDAFEGRQNGKRLDPFKHGQDGQDFKDESSGQLQKSVQIGGETDYAAMRPAMAARAKYERQAFGATTRLRTY